MRVRARDMENGLGNWDGVFVSFEEVKACALVFFDVYNKGVTDHIGLMTRDTLANIVNMMAHSSKSSGFIQIIMEKDENDYWYKRHTKFKILK